MKATVTAGTARYLAGIAALLGREGLATSYLRTSGQSVSIAGSPSVPLLEDVSTALFMRAALGVCDDSLHALHRRIDTLLDSYVNPAQRDSARTGMLSRPTQFAMACLGPAASLELKGKVSVFMQVAQTYGRGDLAGARRMLDSVQKSRRLSRPGDFALDYTLSQSWLSATLGDTANAVHFLDLTLNALPALSYHVLAEPGMAAAVGRSMVYRADLAAKSGDAGKAALWAGRVLTLWSHSDPSLAPTLARMKALASRRS
jgi:hypothetical protein